MNGITLNKQWGSIEINGWKKTIWCLDFEKAVSYLESSSWLFDKNDKVIYYVQLHWVI